MRDELKIVVAIHKPYPVLNNETYLPVHAGAALSDDIGYQSDAQGQSISEKNGLYCELTALYWAWKNLPSDALGLMHYRRYLGKPERSFPWIERKEQVASGAELLNYLEKTPILLPKKREYFIESRGAQFAHAHGSEGLDVLRSVMKRKAEAYLPAFDASMKRTGGHIFNIFVMRRDLADAYCQWMFDILFEVEREMHKAMPEEIKPRLFGFISERMLDCWIETNGYAYTELPVVNMEKQNWLKKGMAFLKRKWRH